jgi:hypothetical protein
VHVLVVLLLQLKASNDDLAVMYGDGYYSPFCKSLRYGATLELVNVRRGGPC